MEESSGLSNTVTNMTMKYPVLPKIPYLFEIIPTLYIACYSIAFVIGIVGNGLIIWIAGFKMKKMVNTIWFFNLSIADFLLNIVLPFHIIKFAMRHNWIFGQIMCKIMNTVFYFSMTLSSSFLMIISVDLCISVLCPVWSKNHRKPRLACSISKAIWLFCLIISSPYVVFFDTEMYDFNERVYCNEVHSIDRNITLFVFETWEQRDQAMVITRFVTIILIPFSIILVCYVLIAFSVTKNKGVPRTAQPFKVMISVVLCFFCCRFPFLIFHLFKIMHLADHRAFLICYAISCCLAVLNSCLNPILYVFIGRDFKKSSMESIIFLMQNLNSDRSNQNNSNIAGTELETMHA
ncbi:chemerin-like receptor 1 [Discoglossus pictus]